VCVCSALGCVGQLVDGFLCIDMSCFALHIAIRNSNF
jgi:hypothetical protein